MPAPIVWGAGIAAGADFASGIWGNIARGAASDKDRKFQAQQAGRSMRFSERMRNTSWQAGIADMEKAGVNAALAYSQGGASSPMGASGSGAMAQMEDVGQGAVSSAQAVRMQSKQMKLLDQQQQEAMARTIKLRSEGQVAGVDAREAEARQQYYFDRTGKMTAPMRELLQARHGASMATSARQLFDTESVKLGLSERRAISQLFETMGGGGAGALRFLPLLMRLGQGAGVR